MSYLKYIRLQIREIIFFRSFSDSGEGVELGIAADYTTSKFAREQGPSSVYFFFAPGRLERIWVLWAGEANWTSIYDYDWESYERKMKEKKWTWPPFLEE